MNHRSCRLTRIIALLAVFLLSSWIPGTPCYADTLPPCGNGVVEPGEGCDDGNLLDGDGCSADCRVEQDCYDPPGTFSFFVWSDANIGSSEDGVTRILQDAVKARKAAGKTVPRFWIGTGDIPFVEGGPNLLDGLNAVVGDSPDGLDYPFACSASRRTFPYFVALGNHDVDGYLTLTPEIQYDYWSNLIGPRLPSSLVGMKNFKWGPGNGHDDRTTYSFDYQNAHFVVLNLYHDDPAYPTTNPIGCVRDDLMQWLEQDLSLTDRPNRFVFGHEPAWSYCSSLGGYGGEFCPPGNPDYLAIPYRPRPYTTTGPWDEAYGRHWGDSLEDSKCPAGSREAFWNLLARKGATAYFSGHVHTYSGRLVQGDGVPRNDVPPYSKTGTLFDGMEGVWDVSAGYAHNSSGSSYVLVEMAGDTVRFEAYDQFGTTEPFHLIESWSVRTAVAPSVEILTPSDGALLKEPASVALTASASSAGGSISSVSWFFGGNPIGGSSAPPFAVTCDNVQAGIYTVTAMAYDNNGLSSVSKPVVVTVSSSPTNDPPTLAPIGNLEVDEEAPVTFTAVATDPDGAELPPPTFRLIGAPPGASVDAATGTFLWTPAEEQGPGSYRFTLQVTDSGSPPLTAEVPVQVTVREVNRPPVAVAPGSQAVAERGTLSFRASAADPDLPANSLRFDLPAPPAGASIDPLTGAFSWTPSEGQGPADLLLTVRVTDAGVPPLSSSVTVPVTVTEVNLPPVLATIGGRSVVAGKTLSFTTSATDPDLPANRLSISMSGAPPEAAFDPVTRAFSWTPPTTQPPGAYRITFIVTDDGLPSLSDSETVTITVTGPPDLLPTVVSPASSGVAPGGTLSLNNTVRNQGGSAAGSFRIGFSLVPAGATGGEGKIPLATLRTVTSLSAGSSSASKTTITIPAATATGRYVVCAKADAYDNVIEIDEGNNELCGTATIDVTRPDLYLTRLDAGAASIAESGKLAVTDNVKNGGIVSAGSSRTAYYLSPNQILGDGDDRAIATTRSVSSLAAGASSGATITLTLPSSIPAGSWFLCARADNANVVIETDETNNVHCISAPLVLPPADLAVTALSTTTASVARGGSLSASNTVRNLGGVKAGSFTVYFYLAADAAAPPESGIPFTRTRGVTSLSAGASSSSTTSLTVPTTTPPGNYFLCAVADRADTVAESDEANNGRCTTSAIQVR